MFKSEILYSSLAAMCGALGDSAAAQCVGPATSQPVGSCFDEWRAPFDEPIATDRPDFTETTSVVPRGRFQLEGGYTFSYDRVRDNRTRDQTLPEFLLRTGVATDWEMRIGWTGYSLTEDVNTAPNAAGRTRAFYEHDDAGSDMNVGFKRHLLKQSGILPEFSIIGALDLPTGASGKTSGDIDPEIKLLWGYDLTDRFSLAGNVNFAAPTEDQSRFFQSAASVSLAYSATDWLGTYVEYFGFYPNAWGADCAHYLDGGFTFLITDNFQIDLRAGIGLNGEADDLFTGIGFAFRF